MKNEILIDFVELLENTNKWFGYSYMYIDYLEGFNKVASNGDVGKLVEVLHEQFRDLGWQGDGEIGYLWLPPFCFKRPETGGHLIWHVKQKSDGISYIVSDKKLVAFDNISTQSHDSDDNLENELRKWLVEREQE